MKQFIIISAFCDFFSSMAADTRLVTRPPFLIPAEARWHLRRYRTYRRQRLRRRTIPVWNTRYSTHLGHTLSRTHRCYAIAVRIVRIQPNNNEKWAKSISPTSATKDNNFFLSTYYSMNILTERLNLLYELL